MNTKQIMIIIIALLAAIAIGLLASTVDAQAPPLPPDGPAYVPVSPLPTPEPTDEPSWWCWQGVCYEW